jgi:hypothetical protein
VVFEIIVAFLGTLLLIKHPESKPVTPFSRRPEDVGPVRRDCSS